MVKRSLWPIPDFAVGLHWAPGYTRGGTLRSDYFSDYPIPFKERAGPIKATTTNQIKKELIDIGGRG